MIYEAFNFMFVFKCILTLHVGDKHNLLLFKKSFCINTVFNVLVLKVKLEKKNKEKASQSLFSQILVAYYEKIIIQLVFV